ncbi:TPA: rRNA pseudouridine synthase [bacterium]|nr:rRNA pseudouridine synthase [bacterium]
MKHSFIRLNKYLANLGVASRRRIESYIDQGKITVNGEIITQQGTKVDPAKDQITVFGKPISKPQAFTYIILNKPKGIIATARDTHNRITVLDIVKSDVRLYPVGRLDQDSEGLILLTNDGDLTYKLTHPKFHIPKTYQVTILGRVSPYKIELLENGIELEDGVTQPTQVKIITQSEHDTVIEIVLHEGKKRQIRRMCASLHLHILALKRISMGTLQLEDLPKGQHRQLTREEIKKLKLAVR